jgi:hypothetical protein
VLASYLVAEQLDIAADPVEQAARRWLADPAAVIVVNDHDQGQLVREAVARLRRQVGAGPSGSAPEHGREGDGTQVEPSDLNVQDSPPPTVATHAVAGELPPAAAEYARRLADLAPRQVHLDEPRVYVGREAYEVREAKRGALGFGSTHPAVEPDVEQRAYVVAPVAPGSGWSYRDMTRALSVAATTHLISPKPDEATAKETDREVVDLRRSLAMERRAEEIRQAAEVEELRSASRRRETEVGRNAERVGDRERVL